jgi:hypothetical protein
MSVQDHVSSSMNDSGTGEKIDTPLTQPGSPNVLRELIVMRNNVGRETRDGYLLSNLIEQMSFLNDDSINDRSWANHPTQKLAWLMNVQIRRLNEE